MTSLFDRVKRQGIRNNAWSAVSGSVAMLSLATLACNSLGADGRLELRVVDAESGSPLAARMRIENSRGRVVQVRQANVFRYGDQIYFDASTTLELRRGQYTFELETGPEYRTRWGHFEIDRQSDDSKTIEMHRFADMAAEGWWAGDLALAAIPQNNLPAVLRAEQLYMAPFVDCVPLKSAHAELQRIHATESKPPRYFGISGYCHDSLPGCYCFNARWPDELSIVNHQTPVEVRLLHDIRTAGGRSVAARADDLLLPVYLASGDLDALQIIPAVEFQKVKLKPRDELRFPGNRGNGRFAEAIYHQLLETGLRVPPAAGSGSSRPTGVIPGASRVYVHCGEDFSYERWWDGLVNGRVFVTNGPLIRSDVRGQTPGYVFRIRDQETIDLEIGLQLATRDKIEYLEIIKNGQVESEVRLDEWQEKEGRLPTVHFAESGWFVVRAVTTQSDRYQFATTGAYYVEKDGKPRISRRAVQFFLDWIDDARDASDVHMSNAGLAWARDYWQRRLAQANAD